MSELTAEQVDAWLYAHGQARITREVAAEALLALGIERRHPFPGNRLRRVDMDPSSPDYGDRPEVAELSSANLVTSEMVGRRSVNEPVELPWLEGLEPNTTLHRLVLDIDHRAWVVPSTTPGHSHLYLDVPMEWDSQAVPLLYALTRAGVVESGYTSASISRGYTAVRLPWIRKGARRAVA